MKILVTGGAGYIGSHTAVALHQAGHTPIILDDFRNSSPSAIEGIAKIIEEQPILHTGDCTDAEFVQSVFSTHQIDGVIHFVGLKSVGESVQKPLDYYRNNVDSLLTVLEAMQKFQTPRLIFSSSATVYGEADACPITEEAPTKKSASPYGNTKQICEDIIADTVASRAFPLQAIALRYFNPIGAHPSGYIGELPIGTPNNLVPYLTQAAAKKRGQLTVFGNDYPTPDGTGVRDFIHVMDLAEAHLSALDYLAKKEDLSSRYEIFNVGTGRGTSVLELIDTFEKINGVPVPHTFGPRRPGDIATCFADARKIEQTIGWQAKRPISEALKDAWNWEQRNNAMQNEYPI
ncbi:MAG: UDP-glucose 4-epimerase GalE [Candidatus Moranbacteria bacterium]|nr:UDP-glucose 4-epimerase GalE [Candidatus Moranbacteria bacterium]